MEATKKVKRQDIVPGSQPALRSQILYFDNLQYTDLSLVSTHVENVIPFFPLSDPTNPIEFHIHSSAHFINLKDSSLYIQLRVLKASGEKLVASDKVTCCNFLLHSLWKECEVILNGTPIFCSGDNYALKAYVTAQLGYGTEKKFSDLSSALYFKDDSGTISMTDSGQKKRADFLSLSKIVELEGPLICDMTSQNRYIPNNTHIIIRLKRHAPEFVLMTEPPAAGTTTATTCPYKLEIVKAQFKVQKMALDPGIAFNIQRTLDSNKLARIPMKRTELRYLYVPSNLFSAVAESIVVGQLPEKLIVMALPTETLNGKISTNPFDFRQNNISAVIVVTDSEFQSVTQQIKIDSESELYLEAYRSLNLLVSNADIGNGISRSEYTNGNFFTAFEIRPRNSQNTMLTSVSGNIRLEVQFKTAVSTPLTILIYCIYEAIVNFDKDRNYSIESLV